jgi:hypothetical protein
MNDLGVAPKSFKKNVKPKCIHTKTLYIFGLGPARDAVKLVHMREVFN